MDLLFVGIFVAMGLMSQVLSVRMPFRSQTGPRQLGWDTIAALFFAASALLLGLAILDPTSAWLKSSPIARAWYLQLQDWPWALTVALNLLLSDFLTYWAHRALHGGLLWHAHAWHHSPKHVWWLSGLRASPIHTLLTTWPGALAFVVFPLGADDTVPFVIVAVFGLANQHWLHSNIAFPYARTLETFLVTPRVHFVHHSADMRFTNSNYGFVFTWWDRMFGTYVDPDRVPANDPLGLDYENSYLRLMFGLSPRSIRPAGAPVSSGTVP